MWRARGVGSRRQATRRRTDMHAEASTPRLWQRGAAQLARSIARGEVSSRAVIDAARTAAEVGVQMGWLSAFPVPLIYLTDILNERGELPEAERLLVTHGLTGSLPASHAFTEFLGARGRLRLSQGQLEQGIEDLEEMGRRLKRVGDAPPNLRALIAGSLVPALLRADRRGEAQRIADEALRGSQAFGQPRFIAAGLRAHALIQPGVPDLDGLQDAASIYERIRAPHELARTLLAIGTLLRRQRRPTAAREPLRRALDLARSCGARPLAERAEHELRQRRAPAARPIHRQRRAHSHRATRRATRDRRSDQPADRRDTVHHSKDGREPPRAHLPQTQHPRPDGAGRGPTQPERERLRRLATRPAIRRAGTGQG